MAGDLGELSITIRVNKQTGDLELIKGQVAEAGKSVEGFGKASSSSAEMTSELTGAVTKLLSVTALLSFFKEAIAEATAEAEAIRHLKAQMDALGISYDQHQEEVSKWAESMERLAHIHGEVAYDALGRTIQRTGDLTASMQLVQLAQDIFIATGRDFNSTLENLAVAAGGSSRGLTQLQMQFGQQISSATTAAEAIKILADNYGGAAEKAEGLAVAGMDSSISINKVYEKVGKELTPALQFLSDYALKPVIQSLLTLEVTLKTIVTVLISSVVGATNVFFTSVKSVSTVINAFIKDDWKGFNEAIKNGFTEIKTVGSEQTAILLKSISEGGRETSEIWKKSAAETKSALKSLDDIPVAPGRKETQSLLTELDRQLSALKETEQLELSNKLLTEDEKIAIIQRYTQREVDAVMQAKAQIGDEELRSANRIEQLQRQSSLKITAIRQQNVENWKQNVTNWATHANNMEARVAQVGMQAFDQLTNSFGQATAEMIMSGKSFADTFEQLFKNLATQVIAQLTAIIARAAILRTLSGTGLGSALGIPIGLAEGGRVYSPTYALIGEGGEPESVVPDSKAQDFARGVLAGGGSRGAAGMRASAAGAGGAGGDAYSFGDIHIHFGGPVDFGTSASRREVLRAVAEELKVTCSETIAFARRSADLAEKYSNRSS